MKVVNPYFLHTLLEPLTGLADDDDEVIRYRSLDPNDEPKVREIIRQMIVPHAKSLTEQARERVKLAYQYYLSKKGDVRFGRVYDSNLLPFDHPNDPRLFFVWVWEECFSNESYLMSDLDEYEERADINETWRV